MVQFIDAVGHPAVRANIDVSHLHLAHVPPAELRKLRGKAIHVHISDCDGKVHGDLPPGRGVVDFVPYLREIKALEIDGSISIELEYAPEPDKISEWVTEAYRETDRLLNEVGLRDLNRTKLNRTSGVPGHIGNRYTRSGLPTNAVSSPETASTASSSVERETRPLHRRCRPIPGGRPKRRRPRRPACGRRS